MINNRRNLISGLACLLTFTSLVPSQAYAYIDPGTGSILLQGLIAAIAGIVVTGKLYWSRIKSALGIGKKNLVTDSSATDSSANAEAIADEPDREQS